MSLSERTAYLRGLYEGMELNTKDSREAKLLGAVIDVLHEMAAHISENEDSIDAITDQLDDVANVLDDFGELISDDEPCALGNDDYEDCDSDSYEDAFTLDQETLFDTNFEVECPNCKTMLCIGSDNLSSGIIKCDTCGESFQINLAFQDEQEES